MRPASTVIVRFHVDDYDVWKAAFDAHEDARLRHGGIGHRILRGAEDRLALTVLLDFASAGGAYGLTWADVSLLCALRAGGVEGGPHGGRYDIGYLEEVDAVAEYAR
jgi:hypothetical protein